jgi:hypothetical protein
VACVFKPYTSEVDLIAAHLRENDLRDALAFIDHATAVIALKRRLEQEEGVELDQSEYVRRLKDLGHEISRRDLRRMGYAVECLDEAIPVALRHGLGPRAIDLIRNLHRFYGQYWDELDESVRGPVAFDPLFLNALNAHDDETLAIEAFKDSLDRRLMEVTGLPAHRIRAEVESRMGLSGRGDRAADRLESPGPAAARPAARPEPTVPSEWAEPSGEGVRTAGNSASPAVPDRSHSITAGHGGSTAPVPPDAEPSAAMVVPDGQSLAAAGPGAAPTGEGRSAAGVGGEEPGGETDAPGESGPEASDSTRPEVPPDSVVRIRDGEKRSDGAPFGSPPGMPSAPAPQETRPILSPPPATAATREGEGGPEPQPQPPDAPVAGPAIDAYLNPEFESGRDHRPRSDDRKSLRSRVVVLATRVAQAAGLQGLVQPDRDSPAGFRLLDLPAGAPERETALWWLLFALSAGHGFDGAPPAAPAFVRDPAAFAGQFLFRFDDGRPPPDSLLRHLFLLIESIVALARAEAGPTDPPAESP